MNLNIKFLGVGGAFASQALYQSNAVIELADNTLFLIDCGTDIRHSLKECYPEIHNGNIGEMVKYIYISHVHVDNCGGLEWPAFCTYFGNNKKSIGLIVPSDLYKELWNETLKGGMGEVYGAGNLNLEDYFKVTRLGLNMNIAKGSEPLTLRLIPSWHFNNVGKKNSYGLFISDKQCKLYFTSDVCSSNYKDNKYFYELADVIFHDCETTSYKSNFHFHYNDLVNLPDNIKNKMYLYHYSEDAISKFNPIKDGFLGFVEKGKKYVF